ncbi:MAG: FtsX-like permease family protein [Pseudonocardiales bacterium]
MTATLTFGSGLHTLVTHPRLYGWNWTYAISATNIVPPQATARLDTDPAVAAWTGYHQTTLHIDREIVPLLLTAPGSAVAPPILSGHGVEAEGQIVLGVSTLADLHKRVGDAVVATYGKPEDMPFYIPPTRLTIVGTATLPALSKPGNGQDHLTIGRGGIVTLNLVPPAFQAVFDNPEPTLNGPELALIRLSAVSKADGLAAMQRIADRANDAFAALPGGAVGNHVVVLSVERPAQIANFKTMGAIPLLLSGGLAFGAIAALTFSTALSVRRRKRDLAVMKALGFTGPQLAAAVAVQASVAAVLGIVVGIPLGVISGRALWREFARQIYVVPAATVPWLSIGLVALGALILANVAGAIPGRSASRISVATTLRGE